MFFELFDLGHEALHVLDIDRIIDIAVFLQGRTDDRTGD